MPADCCRNGFGDRGDGLACFRLGLTLEFGTGVQKDLPAALMPYSRYLAFDILGGILWVGAMILGGFFLGRSVPNIGERIHYVIAVVVVLSLIPAVVSVLRARSAVARETGSE